MSSPRPSLLLASLAGLLLVAAPAAAADTIRTRDGREHVGEILDTLRDGYLFRADGAKKAERIPFDAVEKVTRGSAPAPAPAPPPPPAAAPPRLGGDVERALALYWDQRIEVVWTAVRTREVTLKSPGDWSQVTSLLPPSGPEPIPAAGPPPPAGSTPLAAAPPPPAPVRGPIVVESIVESEERVSSVYQGGTLISPIELARKAGDAAWIARLEQASAAEPRLPREPIQPPVVKPPTVTEIFDTVDVPTIVLGVLATGAGIGMALASDDGYHDSSLEVTGRGIATAGGITIGAGLAFLGVGIAGDVITDRKNDKLAAGYARASRAYEEASARHGEWRRTASPEAIFRYADAARLAAAANLALRRSLGIPDELTDAEIREAVGR